jgi:hypothetical protein
LIFNPSDGLVKLSGEARTIADFLRRKRQASEERDEAARNALVDALRSFGNEVEAMRSQAHAAVLFLDRNDRDLLRQTLRVLQLYGQRMYSIDVTTPDQPSGTLGWPAVRALLEEIGHDHTDVLYLRQLRHNFGACVVNVALEEELHGKPALKSMLLDLGSDGDRLVSALGAAARAISERDPRLA